MRILLFLSCFVFFSTAVLGQSSAYLSQIIVKLKSGAATAKALSPNQQAILTPELDNICREYGATKVVRRSAGRNTGQYYYVISFPEGAGLLAIIASFEGTGQIVYAEPNYIGSGAGTAGSAPNDARYDRQWNLKNNGSFPLSPATAGADIEMEAAWEIEDGDTTIVLAILDSGTKLDHPDFEGRIWVNRAEIPDNLLDDDGNGYTDDIHGWDFVAQDNMPSDEHGHGTNVASIAAANGNNSIGIAGVDWHCKVMTVRGLDDNNRGYYDWWAEAIYYATDNGADVINMSLGGTSTSETLRGAIDYALDHDVILVACMMNANSEITWYPAGFPGVIPVGSTDADDTRSKPFFWSSTSGSSYGNHISVVAPGNYIYGLHYQSDTDFDSYWGGTSQAAPHVSGLACLLLAQDTSRTPEEIRQIIEMTAEDGVGNPAEDVSGWDKYYGHGRVNAYRALTYTPAGIKDENVAASLSVFPNPASSAFTIRRPEASPAVCEIYNHVGQSVYRINTTAANLTISEKLPAGVYYISVTSASGVLKDKIIIR